MRKVVRVILTGSAADTDSRARLAILRKLGISVRFLPTIRVVSQKMTDHSTRALKQLSQYDYLLFTSAHAVIFFIQALKIHGIEKPKKMPKIIAVGPTTALACHTARLPTTSMPERFNSQHIVKILKNSAGKKILFPRSAIAPASILKNLRARGASVAVVPLYTTVSVYIKKSYLSTFFDQPVDYMIFMSSSSVQSFSKNLSGSMLKQKALTCPVLCIGPQTAQAAQRAGFKKIHTAETFTMDGIAQTLRRLF